MLHVKLDRDSGIAVLEPEGLLESADFAAAAVQIDPYIEQVGELYGLIIKVKRFPEWDSFGALISHMKFIRDHHRRVSRVAFVTDSPIGSIAEKLGAHFVAAEVREFPFDQVEAARSWILQT